MFVGTAGDVLLGTEAKAGVLIADGAGDCGGFSKTAGGQWGTADLMVISKVVGLVINAKDDEEAGRDCEDVSGTAGKDVSYGA